MPGEPRPTPYLRLDVTKASAAIEGMAAHARSRGLALRPHAKTHKSARLGRMQLEAGAVGLTVATVGEAEVFADGGCDDLFIAYPLWVDPAKARRLAALQDRARVAVGVDSTAGIAAMAAHGIRPDVLVEVDSGHHRTGVPLPRLGPSPGMPRRLVSRSAASSPSRGIPTQRRPARRRLMTRRPLWRWRRNRSLR